MEPPRIAIVHIGKTGGTSVRTALTPYYKANQVCPYQFEAQYPSNLTAVAHYRLYDTHFGFDLASRLDAKLVTVVRNPFDRLISLYHYWREVPSDNGGPGWAKRVDFDRFLEIACTVPAIQADTFNAQTWQLAFSHLPAARQNFLHLSDDDILRQAIKNLQSFTIVGVTEAMEDLFREMNERLGLKGRLTAQRMNVTGVRIELDDVKVSTRRRMVELIHLDLALYDHVCAHYHWKRPV